MAELPTYFNDFLASIRLPEGVRERAIAAHTELTERLRADEELEDVVISTFLQGSYRRSTILKPAKGAHVDVDVVVVTRLDENEWTPQAVQDLFCRFLDRHEGYRHAYVRQGRSLGISLDGIDLDLVVTAAPSESQTGLLTSESVTTPHALAEMPDWILSPDWTASEREHSTARLQRTGPWQVEPLRIPDRDANRWESTDPLTQIHWTQEKNAATNGHYVNIVKALKWWWLLTKPPAVTRPKGFLIEHIVGLNCPDGISSVAEGATMALENIQTNYSDAVARGERPHVPDHGVPENNVFERITAAQFAAFHRHVQDNAPRFRQAFDQDDPDTSAQAWRDIFGDEFPPPSGGGGGLGPPSRGFTPPTRSAVPRKSTFA